MPFDADDLAAFNDPDMPGYAVATCSSGDVAGRFRASYGEAFMVAGSKPAFSAPISDLAAVDVDASVEIFGISYVVAEKQTSPPGMPDMSLLVLEAV